MKMKMAAALTDNTWSACRQKLEEYTSKPENFLNVQNDLGEELKKFTKYFYDKAISLEEEKPKNALPELIIDDFDDEQIWQELELLNEEKCDVFLGQIAKLLAKKDKLVFPLQISDEEEEEPPSPEAGEGGDSDELESDHELQKEEKQKVVKKTKVRKSVVKQTTIVDDKFFKLREMEMFLEQTERISCSDAEADSDEDSIDLFDDDVSEDEEEDNDDDTPSGLHYRDFFDPVDGEEEHTSEGSEDSEDNNGSEEEAGEEEDEEQPTNEMKIKAKKGVRFMEAGSSSGESESGDDVKVEDATKSSFESRQERLRDRIDQIHDEALGEKPWQLKGEVSATSRPQNSLLEEVLEFDMTSRPAPVITEQTTLRLEDIIRQRIKDKAWDDVERKLKPVETPAEYKKKLVLDQEKSKLSLAQIYEQDYLKKQKELEAQPDEEEEKQEESEEHKEVRKMLRNLFHKLDALSNYHFTPKAPAPEVKVVTNLPAITVEEVAPVATSDATLLAPEEVKSKPRGGLLGADERSSTDKKRERRKKKSRQRVHKLARETKEQAKLKSGVINKFSKQKAAKEIERATKEGKIGKLIDTSGGKKAVKSSTAFFTQLQDEVTSLVKTKSQELKRKKGNDKKLTAKKLKL